MTPAVEQLPLDSLKQLIEAHVQLSHFREASFLVDSLLNGKKTKVKTYIFTIRVYSDLLSQLSDTPFLVLRGEPKVVPQKVTAGKTEKDQQKVQKTEKSEGNQQYEVAYGLKERGAREKIFELLKQAQNQYPKNLKVYDLWFEMLEKHIANYASESRMVFEYMRVNKVKLRKRHYSRLCKYNSLSNLGLEAKKACQEAVHRDSENPNNYIYLGQAYMDTGDSKKGQRILASVGKKFSQSEEALWVTAKTYYEKKDLVSAYKYYLKASQHKESKPRDFFRSCQYSL